MNIAPCRSPDGYGGTLRTLNSRVLGSNPIVDSIYSFNGVFPGLVLLHGGWDLSQNLLLLNLGHLLFTGWFLEMKFKCYVWCAVVSHWVRNTLHYPMTIFCFFFKHYLTLLINLLALFIYFSQLEGGDH